MASVVRIDFGDGTLRKLKARHKYIREAVRTSGKSITELYNDPFGGYPFILQALLQPGSTSPITLDKASDLIDDYMDAHKSLEGLTKALVEAISGYLHIEMTAGADEDGTLPNEPSPVEPGRSDD